MRHVVDLELEMEMLAVGEGLCGLGNQSGELVLASQGVVVVATSSVVFAESTLEGLLECLWAGHLALEAGDVKEELTNVLPKDWFLIRAKH